jgi:hypothetical protein
VHHNKHLQSSSEERNLSFSFPAVASQEKSESAALSKREYDYDTVNENKSVFFLKKRERQTFQTKVDTKASPALSRGLLTLVSSAGSLLMFFRCNNAYLYISQPLHTDQAKKAIADAKGRTIG